MTTKVSIKGAAPKFDEQVLKQRQEARHIVYDQTDECTALVRGEIPVQFLTNVIDHHVKGYTLSMKYPPSFGSGSYWCRMEKPDTIKIGERQALDAQVKLEYIAWIESEHDRYKKMLTEQLLQIAEAKEKKKEDDRRAKLLSEVEKEVLETFGDLGIPE
ncbi:hypothetical protein ASE80_13740 [Pseudomonas sp. Leaf15]|uniref:hypothetical protein n=1 Tax=unclassified Pseudomonas TaxID=196821 RepID=UPI0007032D84|nr:MULTISPECIES: hypothetical protein [unclassified Pseudomonas]KQM47694.1 hypothetical protein ASE80_13740 [Pseudomonas sp. Leaf15]RAH01839.1 hypothetical protein DJ480_15345 [Pseudomonas sp. Leaf98]